MVTLATPFLKVICHPYAGTELDIAYLLTKFDHSSFSHSRDMVGAYQNLNGSRDHLTTPLSGMLCHQLASNCYSQPTYQI